MPINTILLKLFLRFIGYNQYRNLASSIGEKNFLDKVCKENPKICIDIGANKGEYSKYILENSQSDVIAFEPFPKSFKKLQFIKKLYLKDSFHTILALVKKRKLKNYIMTKIIYNGPT